MNAFGRILAVAMAAAIITLFGHGTATLGAPAAQFTIVAGQGPANGELNFNGASNGKLVITVPQGAQVRLTLQNKGALPHSLQLIPNTTQLPAQAANAPALPGAETPDPTAGVIKGQTQVAQFAATKAGKYLLICGFPGHALLGMYATLIVAPSSSATPGMIVTQ